MAIEKIKNKNTLVNSSVQAGGNIHIGDTIQIFMGKSQEYYALVRKIEETHELINCIPEHKMALIAKQKQELANDEQALAQFKKDMATFYNTLKHTDKKAFDDMFGVGALMEMDIFFKNLEVLKLQETNLSKEAKQKRREHFDNWERYMESLSKERLFEQQKRDSIYYLRHFNLTVSILKEKLTSLGYAIGEIDDNFDTTLVAALTKFQEDNEMRHIDGMFGELTYQQLGLLLKK